MKEKPAHRGSKVRDSTPDLPKFNKDTDLYAGGDKARNGNPGKLPTTPSNASVGCFGCFSEKGKFQGHACECTCVVHLYFYKNKYVNKFDILKVI